MKQKKAYIQCAVPRQSKRHHLGVNTGHGAHGEQHQGFASTYCVWLEKSGDEQSDPQLLTAEGISATDVPCLASHVASSSEGFQS